MIICIKNWDSISQAPALFLRDRSLVAIVRGYISISGHHKGLASPLPHPEGHTQDECDALSSTDHPAMSHLPSPHLGFGLHLGPVLYQVSHDLCLASSGCHVQRRLSSLQAAPQTEQN